MRVGAVVEPVIAEPSAPVCAPIRTAPRLPLPALGARSADNLRAWVSALAGPELGGREAGTRDAATAAHLVADYFAALGASAPFDGGYCQRFAADGIEDQNVVAHLPGSTCWVVVGAHYDALGVDEHGRVRPGADDNATGVAVMLELGRRMAASPRSARPSVALIAFGAEEPGLLGSHAYVTRPSLPLGSVALMINVDMAGRRPRGHAVIGFEASGPGRAAVARRVRSAARAAGVAAVAMRLGERSDSAAFSPHVPTVFFSTTVHADYHQPTDTPERVDYQQVERTLDLVTELLGSFDCRS